MAVIDGVTHLQGLVRGPSAEVEVVQSTSLTTGVFASVRNPEDKPIILVRGIIRIVQQSSAACTIDMGGAATNVDNAGIFSGQSVASTPANTFYQASPSSPVYVPIGGYMTAFVASGNLNGAQLQCEWYYERVT